MALIHYQKGDIFESNAHVIVNTVNCKGVMGMASESRHTKHRLPQTWCPEWQAILG